MREKKNADVLYWAGCSGAYDSRGRDISQSVANIMNEAGVDYACLGNEETCTGDSARRIGNEYLFQTMAEQNKETFDQYDFKKIDKRTNWNSIPTKYRVSSGENLQTSNAVDASGFHRDYLLKDKNDIPLMFTLVLYLDNTQMSIIPGSHLWGHIPHSNRKPLKIPMPLISILNDKHIN